MSDSVITVESLGKRYRIRHQQQRQGYTTLRDILADKTKGATRRLWAAFRRPPCSALRPPPTEDFWALKDVGFSVRQGETVGIIGRNGAGKSTLLKSLSRITEPTEGRIRIKGRVASLLEVGTGFHPELTGRENIFLNGAILGMARTEIRRKFDEIVAFAETEKFLDTPVKRYSSGMYVRLAFAVAAHLEPEILIVDEVLAVGDAAFQDKCFGKMEGVAKSGRTVLIVSHNMGAIRRMANRAALLDHGYLVEDGPVQQAIEGYLGAAKAACSMDLRDFPDRGGNGQARILSLSIHTEDGSPTEVVMPGSPCLIRFVVDFKESVNDPLFQLLVESVDGDPLLDLRSSQWGFRAGNPLGLFQIEVKLDSLPLVPGRYVLSPCVSDRSESFDLDFVRKAVFLTVASASPYPTGANVDLRMCRFLAKASWQKASG